MAEMAANEPPAQEMDVRNEYGEIGIRTEERYAEYHSHKQNL